MIKPNAGNRVSYVAKLAKASARGARGTAATVPASARTYTGMRLAAAACGLRKFFGPLPARDLDGLLAVRGYRVVQWWLVGQCQASLLSDDHERQFPGSGVCL